MNRWIRAETVADYAEIARVHWDAFNGSYAESLLVGNHRLRKGFDPELSLVAIVNGQVVGHALFSPRKVFIQGKPVKLINLAPIGVLREWQNRAIGSELIRRGLVIAQNKGYDGCFLLGHSTYYARFGFKPGTYTQSGIRVGLTLSPLDTDYRFAALHLQDIPDLMRQWHLHEGSGYFSLEPDPEISGWISVHPQSEALVMKRKGLLKGYLRWVPGRNPLIFQFIASDYQAARQLLLYIGSAPDKIRIPLDPCNSNTRDLFPEHELAPETADSCMICSFGSEVLNRYLQGVKEQLHAPGRLLWPPEFDGLE